MIHCGSRGLGHQVATDSLVVMEKAMKRDNIVVNDRQLACSRIISVEGKDYFFLIFFSDRLSIRIHYFTVKYVM